MKKVLTALAALSTPTLPRLPERFLRMLDRYYRKGKHHDAPGKVAGWTWVAFLRERHAAYDEIKSRYGIQAAIALGY
jgi:hypothetical protein